MDVRKIENNMEISENIREIIHLTGHMCRRFDGYVTDSFTVTLRNNSLIMIINNNFQKKKIYCAVEYYDGATLFNPIFRI